MPKPTYNAEQLDVTNRLILEELRYNKCSLSEEHEELLNKLTKEQRSIFDRIITTVKHNKGGFLFLYDYGGTEKTFIWRTLTSAIKSKGGIVLTVASSGIASLLLSGGQTIHSRFSFPLNTTEDSTCNIRQGSPLASLIVKTKLIIWDEAPMMHIYYFEVLDKTLRDILRFEDVSNLDRPFEGKTVVLGGDFRQIVPVVTKAVGDGIIGNSVDGIGKVPIPNDVLIADCEDPISAIVNSTYPNFYSHCSDVTYL
ncbi:ATP-dependent DNA helicase pif1-like [Capsicum annuum]|uniref:ATP-dependent DNA helicase pif1-like n=1 Tax=Capsicum annuum TaxID=4072 RepID=UPI001FB0753B|nr:ATP-dependent DNA helicase pif1-like [Capsicum annuum]